LPQSQVAVRRSPKGENAKRGHGLLMSKRGERGGEKKGPSPKPRRGDVLTAGEEER